MAEEEGTRVRFEYGSEEDWFKALESGKFDEAYSRMESISRELMKNGTIGGRVYHVTQPIFRA